MRAASRSVAETPYAHGNHVSPLATSTVTTFNSNGRQSSCYALRIPSVALCACVARVNRGAAGCNTVHRHREAQGGRSKHRASPDVPRSRSQLPPLFLTLSQPHDTLTAKLSSGPCVCVCAGAQLSNSYELNDPLLEHFKSRVERRNHTMELVFSLDDAKRIFTVFADHTTNHITAKPVLVLVDEPDEFKRKETLTTLRELDPTRQELLLVSLSRASFLSRRNPACSL